MKTNNERFKKNSEILRLISSMYSNTVPHLKHVLLKFTYNWPLVNIGFTA